jgi:hypothetical protein
MKAAHFGGEDVLLHADELRNPTTEQLDALSKFFHEQQFARLAVTMSKSAVLPTVAFGYRWLCRQVDIAAEMQIDRIKVVRMIKSLKRLAGAA